MENIDVPQTINKEISRDVLTGVMITMAIITVSVYMPIIGFFCSLFLPLPVLFYRSKLGRKTGLIVPGAAMTILLVLAGGISIDVVFFLEMLFLGFLLSELFEMNLSVEKTVMYACGGVLLTGVVGLVLYSNLSATGITSLVSVYIAQNLEMTVALYQGMGASEEFVQKFSNSLEQIQYGLIRIIPAMVTASFLLVTWSNLLMARPILKSRGLFIPEFGALKLWKAPDYLIWVLIGCGGFLMLPGSTLKIVGLNGLLVLLILYFFQGIAIVSFFFEKKQFPRLLRVFFYTLIAIQQIVLLVVIGLGIFDMWINFRKINIKNKID
jgi:uncharacterized protein YybS (DUF2232 family)